MREPAAPGKPIELPPDVARRFFKDLRAFLAEKNTAVLQGTGKIVLEWDQDRPGLP
jgi:hypothetical protein